MQTVRKRNAQPTKTVLPQRLAIAAGLIVLVVCTTASAGVAGKVLTPPSFRPAAGWWMLTTGPASRIAPETWVASDRGTDQEALFNLFVGLRRLTPYGIVIWASNDGRGEANTTYPLSSLPLQLQRFRIYRAWEGQPAGNVQQRLLDVSVLAWHLDVRVYFGTQHPDKATVAKAQAELNRLLLP